MSRIQVLTAEQTPAGARPLLDGVQKAYGMVPNVFKVLAHSPAALGSYLQFHQANETTSLTARQRETVSLAVSQANGCEYCLSVHSLVGSKVGLSPDELLSARAGNLDAYADFAREVTASRGQISDEVLANARAGGLSDAVIIEIISQVTLLVFTNLLNNVAKTTLDFPPVQL
ncbi:carboxymuconolactone decarboxylase family protein [Pseudomonas sp. Pseusp122]|uniref:carboxymuconolactone decarboxylase family protein n=1 Tax=unclassified Pseudomonas TaxID=196821 RepID=UPI0039A66591